MGDGLKFFSAKLHLIKNHDIVRRFCRALEGSVCLEEEVDYRRVRIPSMIPTKSTCSFRNTSGTHNAAPNSKEVEKTYILFPW